MNKAPLTLLKQKICLHSAERALQHWKQPLCSHLVFLQHANMLWFITSIPCPNALSHTWVLTTKAGGFSAWAAWCFSSKWACQLLCSVLEEHQASCVHPAGDKGMRVALSDSAQVWPGPLPSLQCQGLKTLEHPCKVMPALHLLAFPAWAVPYPEYPTPAVIVANKVNDIYKPKVCTKAGLSKLSSDLSLPMFRPASTLRN